ncbi:type VII secretion target [Plantactinospora sonchi]|uniref:Type VII secretion target n=1 Tax=Plantactinospora sonchi TaxID=1544735 RepID=A0ABU7S4X8_9ACTN
MSDDYAVDTAQIRAHAAKLDDLHARFDAVKAASAHISQNDAAYGMLCGWIAGILEGRHVRQDQLVAYVQENLTLAAGSLRTVADNYDTTDSGVADLMARVGSRLG